MHLLFAAVVCLVANEALDDALYDSQALRTFAGIDLGAQPVPDATTLLKFWHLLEKQGLTRQMFVLMREGTIVDATIIAAPASTKNKAKARDPEMHQTKKINAWHFGMKAHIARCATEVSPRTRRNSARFSPWPTWSSPKKLCGHKPTYG